MNILENLLGGDDQKRNELQDFTNRYEQGAPHDNLSDSEVQDRYAQVAPQLSDQDYQMSAEQAFERMPAEERVRFGQMLQSQAREQGYQDPAWDEDDNRYQDPGYLAQATSRVRQERAGVLAQLLGGAGGGMSALGGGGMQGTIAKAALGGIAAMAVKKMMSGR